MKPRRKKNEKKLKELKEIIDQYEKNK